jgi:hypothetical protein
MPRKCPPEFQQRALRLLEEALPDHEYEATCRGQARTYRGGLLRWRRVTEAGPRPRFGCGLRNQAAEVDHPAQLATRPSRRLELGRSLDGLG